MTLISKKSAAYPAAFLLLLSASAWALSFRPLAVKAGDGTKLRLGVSVPSSVLTGFGARQGVSIDLSYSGGQAFYAYMTRGPGYFSHIQITMGMPGIWDWGGLRSFLKGMLDSADSDNGKCEISISLFGVDLGWYGWAPLLLEVLEAVGSSRASMRYIIMGGEWSYKNKQPPTYDELKTDWQKARDIVKSYGYEFGVPDGKYISAFSQDVRHEVWTWGPRVRAGQLNRNPDISSSTLTSCYQTANWFENPTDVYLECFTMWDTAANIPASSPYYIYKEKFDSFVKGAVDRYDASGGVYPQSVLFEVMPETFNDVEGVSCPYLDWWFGSGGIADKYNLRTSKSAPVAVRVSPDLHPSSPFPPYPTEVGYTNSAENLPPFYVQAGGTFNGGVYAKEIHNWVALGGRDVEIYAVKQGIMSGELCRYDHPLTHQEWDSRILIGKITTKSDGWSATFVGTAPSEPGRYTVIARVPSTSTEMEGFSSAMEFILVSTKTHKVEVRSNVKIRLAFGPSAYGPPWSNCDPERWLEPSKPITGLCSEENWSFIAPSEVTDDSGRVWKFSQWEDGSTNPSRSVYVGKDLILSAYYSTADVAQGTREHVTLSLRKGYNLLSLPLLNDSLSASSLLGLIGDAAEGVFRFDASSQKFIGYDRAMASSGMTQYDFKIEPNIGYFIYVVRDVSFTVAGVENNLTRIIPLKKGYNLIGWTCSKASTVKLGLMCYSSVDAVFGFDPVSQTFVSYDRKTAELGLSQADFQLVPGAGYFVYANKDDNLLYGEA